MFYATEKFAEFGFCFLPIFMYFLTSKKKQKVLKNDLFTMLFFHNQNKTNSSNARGQELDFYGTFAFFVFYDIGTFVAYAHVWNRNWVLCLSLPSWKTTQNNEDLSHSHAKDYSWLSVTFRYLL